jgi:hypothetical protein
MCDKGMHPVKFNQKVTLRWWFVWFVWFVAEGRVDPVDLALKNGNWF